MKIILLFCLGLLTVNSSFANTGSSGILADIGILKFDTETSGPNFGNTKNINTYYDLKVGYLTGTNLYVGAIYSAFNQDNGVTQPKRTLFGVTVGYHNNGWLFDGSYFFDGQLDAGNSFVFKKATGFGIDLGYQYMTSSNFFFGVEGSYKTYTFAEVNVGSASQTVDNKVKSEMYPMLLLGFIF